MILYFKIKKKIEDRFSFDAWVERYLVHYNYYLKRIEIKENFVLQYYVHISPFMKISKPWKKILKKAFS